VAPTTGLVGNAQVTGIDEPDELRRLVVEQRVAADGIGGAGPVLWLLGVDVRRFLREAVGIAAVAVGAPQSHGRAAVHVADAGVAGDAAVAFAERFLGALAGPVGTEEVIGQGQRIGGVDGRMGPVRRGRRDVRRAPHA